MTDKMPEMKVLILAGGFATRLWPLCERRAKPLLLLGGKTILERLLEKIPENFEVFLLTNQKFEEDFEAEIQKLGRTDSVRIFCEDAHSDGEKVGALAAISLAISEFEIDENILILAGDNLCPELQIEQLFCSKNEAKIAVREVNSAHEAQKFGVVEVCESGGAKFTSERKICDRVKSTSDAFCQDGRGAEEFLVSGFEEKPAKPKSKLVSTGFCGIGSGLFPILHKFSKKNPDALGAIFSEFLHHDARVSGTVAKGDWFDVGSFESYLAAHKKLQAEKVCREEEVCESGNVFGGKVFLGKGCEVRNCRIFNSIIYPGTTLRNCHISESVVDEDCRLEGLDLNRKLVRRGTVLEMMHKKTTK